jgi:hypothetical protein
MSMQLAQLGRACRRALAGSDWGIGQRMFPLSSVYVLAGRSFRSSRQNWKEDPNEEGGTVGERLTRSSKEAVSEHKIDHSRVEELAEQGRKQSPEVEKMEKKLRESDELKDDAGVRPEKQAG